jgi:hypothetical protein
MKARARAALFVGAVSLCAASADAGQKHHRFAEARKNGRVGLCSEHFGFYPTCWRSWPEGGPVCPMPSVPIRPMLKPAGQDPAPAIPPNIKVDTEKPSEVTTPAAPPATSPTAEPRTPANP